jgi:uncharacterized protein (DUF305 family)
MTHIMRTLALPVALVATLALSACGTGTSTPSAAKPSPTATPTATRSPVGPPATGANNPADVTFATAMISYHLQAAQMADLAPKNASSAKIKAFAPKITAPQGQEVTAMAGWLVGGGLPVPDANGGGAMAGHDMSGTGGAMPGTMSAQDMAALGKASGKAFDRMWLTMMLKHHEGALATAQTELTAGLHVGAKQIAKSVIQRQSAEIATMKSILTGLSG